MTVTTLLLLKDLTPTQKSYVTSKLNTKEKETSTAYICWILCGIHYFYLGQPIKNILYWINWITCAGFGIWGIIDLFRMKSLVEECNEKIVQELIQEATLLES